MTVLSVAYPFAKVSLNTAGGAEQILALMDRGLAARGHRSIVIAAEGSEAYGKLVPVPVPYESTEHSNYEQTQLEFREAILRTIRDETVNVIHMHGLDFDCYLPEPETDTPVLATLHLPPSFYNAGVFSLTRPRLFLNCVSQAQLRCCPPSRLIIGAIGNGIPLDLLHTAPVADGGYALAMGRICPEKGFHLAADAAEAAGVPLYLAGKVFPYTEHIRYWRETLLPRLGPPHRYLGPVGIAEKAQLLASARCLLVPSLVAETSSLVAMESLACGTPVIAFPNGALGEVIDSGSTGFLVRDAAEMADAIRRVNELDRGYCRTVARERFSAERMVEDYVSLYGRILKAA